MNRDELLRLCGGYPYFDLAFLLQMSGQSAATINQNVKRWLSNGILVALRRGLYTLPDHLRRVSVPVPRLANDLYPPSYLTDTWALSFHGLIPDVSRQYTSATPRRPTTFTNAFGSFAYRHLHDRLFWGFDTVSLEAGSFRCASPEKALIDHWYWSRGEWTPARMRELRLQQFERIDADALGRAVERVDRPRIRRACEVYVQMARET